MCYKQYNMNVGQTQQVMLNLVCLTTMHRQKQNGCQSRANAPSRGRASASAGM